MIAVRRLRPEAVRHQVLQRLDPSASLRTLGLGTPYLTSVSLRAPAQKQA